MYVDVYQSPYGAYEITADEKYLLSLKLTKNQVMIKTNYITNLVKKQLDEYFYHERINFDVPIKFSDSFSEKILKTLYQLDKKKLYSYKTLGELAGYSNAMQAVGTVMKNNRLPIIIPCHIIIKSDGTYGQYAGGKKVKEQLINFELTKQINLKYYYQHTFSKQEIAQLKTHNVLKKLDIIDNYQVLNDPFVCLCVQIIYQQVAYKAARTVELRLFRLCDLKLTVDFILDVDKNSLQKIGLTHKKVQYMKNIARFFKENDIDYLIKNNLLKKMLLTIKGIGPWTIEMFDIFYLVNKNTISYKDLVILKQIKKLSDEDLALDKFSKSIKGIETLVSVNLWNQEKKEE